MSHAVTYRSSGQLQAGVAQVSKKSGWPVSSFHTMMGSIWVGRPVTQNGGPTWSGSLQYSPPRRYMPSSFLMRNGAHVWLRTKSAL